MKTQMIKMPTVANDDSSGKSLYDKAKSSLYDWEVDINTHMAELAKLNDGDKHQAVYEALRDVVMFACWCMDNQQEAATEFTQWNEHKPNRKSTNPYQQPVNLIFDRAGVQLESITEKRCIWAKVAAYLHTLINEGTVNESNLIHYVQAKGGIRSLYDSIPLKNAAGRPKANGTGRGLTAAGKDAKTATDLQNLRDGVMPPVYAVAFFDLAKSTAFNDSISLGNYLTKMPEFVEAYAANDDDLDVFKEEADG